MPTRPCCHSIIAQRIRGFAEDRFVLRQQRARNRESLERRSCPSIDSAGHAEYPSDVDQRLQRAVIELERRVTVRRPCRSRRPGRT